MNVARSISSLRIMQCGKNETFINRVSQEYVDSALEMKVHYSPTYGFLRILNSQNITELLVMYF